ncbi:MAG: hypothetical protein LBB59_04165 [Campylobacteraceae bacterium]|jgi:hypothetical protein|nr:hypothetical protein [Campylobacteraceae bacterium]
MKKIVFIFNILLAFCFSNTTIINIDKPANLNQTIYKNMIETPFGFSVDLQGYEHVAFISNSETLPLQTLFLTNIHKDSFISFEINPLTALNRKNLYDENNFVSEITNPTDNATIFFYANSTIYTYNLNDNYKAYVIMSDKYNDEMKAAIFKDSKFVISLWTNDSDRKTIENLLHSIRKNTKAYSKKDYWFLDLENLQMSLLHSSLYYIYNPKDEENIKFLNRVLDIIGSYIFHIKNEINANSDTLFKGNNTYSTFDSGK